MSQAALTRIISRRSPAMAALTREVLAAIRPCFPGATELVYDKKNSLVIGFSPDDRPSNAVASIATYTKWINLYFFVGDALPDPDRLLQGSGTTVRSIRLTSANDLQPKAVKALISAAVKMSEPPFRRSAKLRVIIRQSR
ncbi:MAG: hypothetical protein RLZZ53_952 [Acidobacteriota bacterium]|jgi:hypothetical protein